MTCADLGSSHSKSRISSIGLLAADLPVTDTRYLWKQNVSSPVCSISRRPGPVDVYANCLLPCRTL